MFEHWSLHTQNLVLYSEFSLILEMKNVIPNIICLQENFKPSKWRHNTHVVTWFIPFWSINWRKSAESNCLANLPAQIRTWVNGSFPFNSKGCVKGRIHFSASTMTCRRTILRVHGSLLGPGPSPAPRRSWHHAPAQSCQLSPELCQKAIILWIQKSLGERATDNQLVLKNNLKSSKHTRLHHSSPDIVSTINLLQSQNTLGFASLLHLAGSNQLCAVLMTFNC